MRWGRQLQRHLAGQRYDTALAGAVMHAARRAAIGRPRGQVDDRARPPRRDHALRDGLGAEARALQIDAEHEIPVALAQFEERHAREHADIVDQHVDRSELRLDRRHDRLDLGELADVAPHRQRTAPARPDLIGDVVRRALVVEPVDRDIGARSSAAQGDRPPDPLLCPGHQNHFAG